MRTHPSSSIATERASTEADSTDGQVFQPFVLQPVPRWKRVFDLTLSALTLPLTLAVGAVCSALILIVSPGPLLFTQERVGYAGRRFKCYKFRTMRKGSDTTSHQNYFRQLQNGEAPMQKLDAADPRIIPFGRIIRALGLDELPQLINILRGEMSFVGPRPCTPFELQRYEASQMERFTALPGLTGLWQVRGKNRTTFPRMIELDIEYARQQSPIQDVKILIRTPITLGMQLVEAVAGRRGVETTSASSQASPVQNAPDTRAFASSSSR